jgi:hypothetical protein
VANWVPDKSTELTDMPSTFSGQAGKVATVKGAEDGYELLTPTVYPTTFPGLTDVPSYSGQAGKVATVNGTEDGVEFLTPTTYPTAFDGLTDTPSSKTANREIWVNAAGTSLEYRDSYRVDIRNYTLNNDGKCIRSGSITASDNTLTDTYSLGLFSAGDVGKAIIIKGAGVAGADLTTTIASYTSANEVEITDAASATVIYASVGWGTSDATAAQSAITAAGEYGTIYIPPHLNLFLGGTDLISTAEGQSFCSEGNGAALICGGFNAAHKKIRPMFFRFIGPGTNGLVISDPSLQQFDLNPNDKAIWWSEIMAAHLRIWDKTYGIYNTVAGQSDNFLDVRTWECNTGAYINHNNHYAGYTGAGGTGSAGGDSGDWSFNECRFSRGAIGMHIVKHGGLTLNNIKIHSSSDVGMLIETTGVDPPTQGFYSNNLRIEDCTNYTLKVSSTSGTSTLWPRWLEFIGGTMHGPVLLDKVKQITFTGVAMTTSTVTLNANAASVLFMGCDANGDLKGRIAGAGTDYMIIGNSPTTGPYIESGARVTLIDSTGTKYL